MTSVLVERAMTDHRCDVTEHKGQHLSRGQTLPRGPEGLALLINQNRHRTFWFCKVWSCSVQRVIKTYLTVSPGIEISKTYARREKKVRYIALALQLVASGFVFQFRVEWHNPSSNSRKVFSALRLTCSAKIWILFL